MSDIISRLNDIWRDDDHERGCQGRTYNCTCGFDNRTFKTAEDAVTRIEQLERENAELLEKVKILEGHLDAAIDDYNEARKAALEEAAQLIERDEIDASGRLDPARHESLGDWLREQRAAAIRRLAEQEGTE